LSYQAIGLLQAGQWDAGHTIDARRGKRWMHTFKKLPIKAPNSPAMMSVVADVMAPEFLPIATLRGTA
jgi:hypothetical protein